MTGYKLVIINAIQFVLQTATDNSKIGHFKNTI